MEINYYLNEDCIHHLSCYDGVFGIVPAPGESVIVEDCGVRHVCTVVKREFVFRQHTRGGGWTRVVEVHLHGDKPITEDETDG